MSGEAVKVLLGGLAAFAEAILGVGLVLPGELTITGIASSADPATRSALLAAVTFGAMMGDHLNYWLGRFAGPRLGTSRVVECIGRQHWDRAIGLVHRHGVWAVAASRLLPVVRTVMPAVAGASQRGYRRFAFASLVGSLAWASVWVTAGNAVRGVFDNPAWLWPAAVVAGVMAVVLLMRRRRSAPDAEHPRR